MTDPRTIVITGASRGLGLASAARLYAAGWHVVAAMRSPDSGLERLRAVTGAAPGDPRLTAVTLDLTDVASIAGAAKAIIEAVGAPDVVVHNAAFVAVGCLEEMPSHVIEQIFTTNVLGPVRLTKELLPAMRQAGRGRFVVVSSVGGIRGMPAISIYSASKGALERWAESLAHEIAPFGVGVTVLSTGTFRTDVYDEDHTTNYAERQGPYAPHHAGIDRVGERVIRSAKPPERFASALEKALENDAPFVRRAIGAEARMMLMASRLLPGRVLQSVTRAATGLPRPRTIRPAAHETRARDDAAARDE
jgi:NAD(P)-dependent dehydrogenase (short-subunit alcohol dehydrogenase family)